MTPRQAALLRFIDQYQRTHGGVSPSFQEMAEGIGLKSKSGIHMLIDALEAQGHIRRVHYRQRAINVIRVPKWDGETLAGAIMFERGRVMNYRRGIAPTILVISAANLTILKAANPLWTSATTFAGMTIVSYPWFRDWELLP